MSFTDSDISSLKSLLERWEWVGYISTAVVFLGCIGEFVAEFTSLRKNEHRSHKLARLSLMVLILGIAGELLSAARTSHFSGLIIANIEGRTAESLERAAKAEENLGTARKEAAQANERASNNEREAAQLHKDAEAEHLARVKIEAAVSFRSLNDKQKRDIGGALSRFGSITAASMWFVNGSADAESFADEIAEAMRSARIHTTTVGGIVEMPEGGGNWDKPLMPVRTGVDITSTSNPAARDPADALFKELTDRGFDAKREPDNNKPENSPPGPVIWVTVLARPKGPQGEYKLQAEREANAKKTNK